MLMQAALEGGRGAIIIPNDQDLCRDIVAEAHRPALRGHGGVRTTTNRPKPFHFWSHGDAGAVFVAMLGPVAALGSGCRRRPR